MYAVIDRGGKREVKKILTGLKAPNGVAFSKGTLFVAERHRITRYDGIEDRLDNPPEAKVVIDNLDPTTQAGHFWKFLALGPDGKLYFNVGAPGNIVMPSYMQAAIIASTRKPACSRLSRMGVRNSVGFDWDPKTKQLWFTNHAPRLDKRRSAARHTAPRIAQEHALRLSVLPSGRLTRSRIRQRPLLQGVRPPALKLGPHIAPLGMRFYTGKMFPAEYQNNIFIAMHGSWNRSTKQGYNVMRVIVDDKGKSSSLSRSSKVS